MSISSVFSVYTDAHVKIHQRNTRTAVNVIRLRIQLPKNNLKKERNKVIEFFMCPAVIDQIFKSGSNNTLFLVTSLFLFTY